jgi:hypothetical protein
LPILNGEMCLKMEYKFKVGDRVKYINTEYNYWFEGEHKGCAKLGDVFIISASGVGISGGPVYSVKGGYKQDTANWNYMEDCFELVPFNKEDIKKNGYRI